MLVLSTGVDLTLFVQDDTERRHMTYGLADITPDKMDMILQPHSFSIFQSAPSTRKSLVYLRNKSTPIVEKSAPSEV